MVAHGKAVPSEEGPSERDGVALCPAHLFGVFLILAGCLVLFLFGRTNHLVCNRASSPGVACELQETFLGARLDGRRIEDVRGVSVEAFSRSDGREPVYRVVVRSSGSDVGLDFPGSAAEDKQRLADDVTRFLDSPDDAELALRRIEVEGWFFGGMSILSGLVVLTYVSEYLLCLGTPRLPDATDR